MEETNCIGVPSLPHTSCFSTLTSSRLLTAAAAPGDGEPLTTEKDVLKKYPMRMAHYHTVDDGNGNGTCTDNHHMDMNKENEPYEMEESVPTTRMDHARDIKVDDEHSHDHSTTGMMSRGVQIYQHDLFSPPTNDPLVQQPLTQDRKEKSTKAIHKTKGEDNDEQEEQETESMNKLSQRQWPVRSIKHSAIYFDYGLVGSSTSNESTNDILNQQQQQETSMNNENEITGSSYGADVDDDETASADMDYLVGSPFEEVESTPSKTSQLSYSYSDSGGEQTPEKQDWKPESEGYTSPAISQGKRSTSKSRSCHRGNDFLSPKAYRIQLMNFERHEQVNKATAKSSSAARSLSFDQHSVSSSEENIGDDISTSKQSKCLDTHVYHQSSMKSNTNNVKATLDGQIIKSTRLISSALEDDEEEVDIPDPHLSESWKQHSQSASLGTAQSVSSQPKYYYYHRASNETTRKVDSVAEEEYTNSPHLEVRLKTTKLAAMEVVSDDEEEEDEESSIEDVPSERSLNDEDSLNLVTRGSDTQRESKDFSSKVLKQDNAPNITWNSMENPDTQDSNKLAEGKENISESGNYEEIDDERHSMDEYDLAAQRKELYTLLYPEHRKTTLQQSESINADEQKPRVPKSRRLPRRVLTKTTKPKRSSDDDYPDLDFLRTDFHFEQPNHGKPTEDSKAKNCKPRKRSKTRGRTNSRKRSKTSASKPRSLSQKRKVSNRKGKKRGQKRRVRSQTHRRQARQISSRERHRRNDDIAWSELELNAEELMRSSRPTSLEFHGLMPSEFQEFLPYSNVSYASDQLTDSQVDENAMSVGNQSCAADQQSNGLQEETSVGSMAEVRETTIGSNVDANTAASASVNEDEISIPGAVQKKCRPPAPPCGATQSSSTQTAGTGAPTTTSSRRRVQENDNPIPPPVRLRPLTVEPETAGSNNAHNTPQDQHPGIERRRVKPVSKWAIHGGRVDSKTNRRMLPKKADPVSRYHLYQRQSLRFSHRRQKRVQGRILVKQEI